MKKYISILALLTSVSAFAQGTNPPPTLIEGSETRTFDVQDAQGNRQGTITIQFGELRLKEKPAK